MYGRSRAAALAARLPRSEVSAMETNEDWLNKTKVMWMLAVLLGVVVGFLYLQAHAINLALGPPKKDKNYFSLEELVPLQSKYAQRMFNGTWISDTEILYTRAGLGGLYVYDVEKTTSNLFISQQLLTQLNTTNVKLSPDRKYLLARSDPLTGFRYSSSARYALHEMETNKTTLIADHQRLELCMYAGEQHSIGYVLNNDVYYLKDAAAGPAALRLTNDGVPGVIYNGVADWVYEEEVLSSGSAMWFSPQGSKVAVASFNDTEVDVANYFYYGVPGTVEYQYPTVENLRYPKVGTKNPDVSLKVTGLNGEVKWMKLNAPVSEVSEDHILGTVAWVNEDEVSVMWLNRRQNKSVLVICNAEDGTCKNEVVREEPEGWIDVTTPEFNGNTFIDVITTPQGEGDEWYHVVKYTRGVKEPTPISSGKRTVIAVMHWDTENDKIYYMSTLDDGPWQKHLWVGGSKTQCITCDLQLPDGDTCRNAGVSLSPGGKYYALSCHGEGPAVVTINKADNDTPIMTWQDNDALRNLLKGYFLPQQKNLLVSVPGGFKGAVKMLIPPEIDLQDPEGSYPMVVNIYTGPNSVRVADGFSLGYHTYVSTNRSVIYCYVEGRGSGYKGKNTLFSINNRLGTYEVEDVINITKALTSMYSWIDKDRIGLWGWSYGGYATAMALTKDTSNVFTCGISVAPVTSWLYYDSIYTERFMGLPTAGDNLVGYEQADVTMRATHLRGKHFLLMHGNADDNVHYQNAMALARVLQENDIAFEQMSYPDEAHALSGVTKHVYHTIDDYWTRCFATFNKSGGFIGRHF